MSIRINSPRIEDDLERLGQQQPDPISKTQMAMRLIEDGLLACRIAEDPNAWRRSPGMTTKETTT